ncbi:MAG TPA: VCBS repeat-containing protein [Bryobacteraceae bacterium]|nr:VCBS repeat-containing protein [Bryobacteraceae bacterium]
MKHPVRTALLTLAGCALLLSNSPAQNAPFQRITVTPLAEAFSSALPVIAADIDGDGSKDLLVGTTNQLLLFRGNGSVHVERGVPILSGARIDNLALVDFDGDGIADIIALTPDGVLLLKSTGSGNFALPRLVLLKGTPARGLLAMDFDQDGNVDLAVGLSQSILMLRGDGQGNFTPGGEYATGYNPRAIVSGDFNGDGIADLAACNSSGEGVSILLGAGGGVFRPEARIAGYVSAIVAADFNGDGKTDLAFAASPGLVIMLGNGDGTFARGTALTDESSPVSLVAGDLDGDGVLDLILGDYYNGQITALLNNGDATFRVSGSVSAYGDTFGMALADLNGDSQLDLITTSYSGQSALIAAGRGTGEFDSPVYLGVLDGSVMRSADIDGDGKQELAVVVPFRKSIWLLRGGVEQIGVLRFDDYPMDVQFGDFNGDGLTDLAVLTTRTGPCSRSACFTGAYETKAGVVILTGHGDGTFELSSRTEAGSATAFVTADFNGDGVLDVAVDNNQTGDLQILNGRGDGSFDTGATISAGGAFALAGADFNGDGISELAMLTGWPTSRSGLSPVFTTYPASQTYGTFSMAQYLRVGDFNGDGRPDFTISSLNDVWVLMNDGSGAFTTMPPVASNLGFYRTAPVVVSDFDRDGKDDLAILSGFANLEGGVGGSVLLLSNGDGSFRNAGALPIPTLPVVFAAGTWNDDGKPDLAVLSAADGTVTLLRNQIPPP